MIVAVASRKASPGVTTLTALLAGFWQEPDVLRVIVEADASGGTLAARWNSAHDLSWDPGLLAMSAMRGQLDGDSLRTVTQPLAENVCLAAAPPGPGQIESALMALGDKGAAALAAAPGVRVFVDCGRLSPSRPAVALARRAALTIVVCRPNLDEVYAVQPGIRELQDAGCTVGLVCVGEGQYHPTEIAESCQVDLVGVVPDDERAATAFNTDGFSAGRSFSKSQLARRMGELASHVQVGCAQSLVPHQRPIEVELGGATDQLVDLEGPAPVGFASLVRDRPNGSSVYDSDGERS